MRGGGGFSRGGGFRPVVGVGGFVVEDLCPYCIGPGCPACAVLAADAPAQPKSSPGVRSMSPAHPAVAVTIAHLTGAAPRPAAAAHPAQPVLRPVPMPRPPAARPTQALMPTSGAAALAGCPECVATARVLMQDPNFVLMAKRYPNIRMQLCPTCQGRTLGADTKKTVKQPRK